VAVRLRLTRKGKKKQPTYRIVAADSRSPRDGRFIEIMGFYDPRPNPSIIEVDNEKALKWLRNGAQPSDRVKKLLIISGAWSEFTGEAPPVTVTPAASGAVTVAEPDVATVTKSDAKTAVASQTASDDADAAIVAEATAAEAAAIAAKAEDIADAVAAVVPVSAAAAEGTAAEAEDMADYATDVAAEADAAATAADAAATASDAAADLAAKAAKRKSHRWERPIRLADATETAESATDDSVEATAEETKS